MKKNTKKLLSLVFAVVMTACTVVLAFAAEPKEDTASPNALKSLTFNSGNEYTLGFGSDLPESEQSAFVTEMKFYLGLLKIDFSTYIKWTGKGPNWYGEDCAVRLMCYAIYKRDDHYAGGRVEKTVDNYFTFPRVGSVSVPYNMAKGSLDLTSVNNSGSHFNGWDQFYTVAHFYRDCDEGENLDDKNVLDLSILIVNYSDVKQLDS